MTTNRSNLNDLSNEKLALLLVQTTTYTDYIDEVDYGFIDLNGKKLKYFSHKSAVTACIKWLESEVKK
jgi:hypothetical protein